MNNWIQILIPVAVILGPLLGQLIKKLNEQAELKKIELERERVRDELLRTGRSPDGVVVQATERARLPAPKPAPQGGAAARTNLEEIARRRQAQLEELRRRQQAARVQPTVRPQPTVRAPAPPAGAPARSPIQAAPPTRRAQPAPRQQARPARPKGKQPIRTIRPAGGAGPAPSGYSGPSTTLAQLGTLTNTSSVPAPARQPAMRLPGSVSEWRRAIVLAEVLGPPVSLRDESF